MDEKVITPKELKQAREDAKKPATRLIKFPDGMTRHITLPGWKWAVLDRFDREDVLLSSEKIIGFAFEAAQADKRYPDKPFEETLRYHLDIYLEAGVTWSSAHIEQEVNDA